MLEKIGLAVTADRGRHQNHLGPGWEERAHEQGSHQSGPKTRLAGLERWSEQGIPEKRAAWPTAAAEHRAIDLLRRGKMVKRRRTELADELPAANEPARILIFNEGYSATAGRRTSREFVSDCVGVSRSSAGSCRLPGWSAFMCCSSKTTPSSRG
jgi:hypothetical protein